MNSHAAAPLDLPEVDAIWIDAAGRCGFRVVRGETAYASTDGGLTIIIGTRALLDADDCVAQLVFHELCHALVQGEANWRVPDWGLDNTTDRDDEREAACLRLQAHWAARRGLRAVMTPTTPWKTYYRDLPDDPLFAHTPADEPACALAAAAVTLAARTGMDVIIDGALAATAAALAPAMVMAPVTADSALAASAPPAAVAAAGPPPAAAGLHPVGFAFGPAGETCATCAWIYRGGRGPAVERCRQSTGEVGDGRRTRADLPACARWEPPVDCLTCGACCREAYHSVSVSVRDPVVWKQPGLLVRDGHRFSILRAGSRCAALEGEQAAGYHCRIYEDRPRTCRDFEQGGRHCLVARRRVGLSPA